MLRHSCWCKEVRMDSLCSPVLPGLRKARKVQFHTLPIISKGSRMFNTRKRRPDPHCSNFKGDPDSVPDFFGRQGTGRTINKLITSAGKVGTAGQQMRKNIPSSWDWNTVGAKSFIWNKLHKNEDWSTPKVWRASFQPLFIPRSCVVFIKSTGRKHF